MTKSNPTPPPHPPCRILLSWAKIYLKEYVETPLILGIWSIKAEPTYIILGTWFPKNPTYPLAGKG